MMCGLKPEHYGAAAIDVVECTMQVGEYRDPKNPNLIYYDLPGVGTSNFPRDQYLNRIREVTRDRVGLDQFAFFLIVSADRFKKKDAWLARQVAESRGHYFFI